MVDYRKTQLAELTRKIEETKSLLSDSSMSELAQKELEELEKQKNDYYSAWIYSCDRH